MGLAGARTFRTSGAGGVDVTVDGAGSEGTVVAEVDGWYLNAVTGEPLVERGSKVAKCLVNGPSEWEPGCAGGCGAGGACGG